MGAVMEDLPVWGPGVPSQGRGGIQMDAQPSPPGRSQAVRGAKCCSKSAVDCSSSTSFPRRVCVVPLAGGGATHSRQPLTRSSTRVSAQKYRESLAVHVKACAGTGKALPAQARGSICQVRIRLDPEPGGLRAPGTDQRAPSQGVGSKLHSAPAIELSFCTDMTPFV